MKTITQEQLNILIKLRNELITDYNNKRTINYTQLRDLDILVDELNN